MGCLSDFLSYDSHHLLFDMHKQKQIDLALAVFFFLQTPAFGVLLAGNRTHFQMIVIISVTT
jgi:hypothetical protein